VAHYLTAGLTSGSAVEVWLEARRPALIAAPAAFGGPASADRPFKQNGTLTLDYRSVTHAECEAEDVPANLLPSRLGGEGPRSLTWLAADRHV
jgi:hypothetical protein